MRSTPLASRAIAFGALACGALVTVVRWPNILGLSWLDALGLRASASARIAYAAHGAFAREHLPDWFLGSFPDFAFAVAVGAAMARAPRGYRLAGLVLAAGYELAQRVHLVPGTFDPLDLLGTFLGYPLGLATALFTRTGAAARSLPELQETRHASHLSHPL